MKKESSVIWDCWVYWVYWVLSRVMPVFTVSSDSLVSLVCLQPKIRKRIIARKALIEKRFGSVLSIFNIFKKNQSKFKEKSDILGLVIGVYQIFQKRKENIS